MTNTPDKFSFNGYAGCDIKAYRGETFLGDIRAFSVEGKSGTILILSNTDYVGINALKGGFNIVLTAADEHWRMKVMTVYGCKLEEDVIMNEMNHMTIESVDWWEDVI